MVSTHGSVVSLAIFWLASMFARSPFSHLLCGRAWWAGHSEWEGTSRGRQSPPLLWQQICQQGVSAVGAGGHCRWNLFIYSSDVLPPVYRINVIIQDRAWCDFPYSMTCARKKCYRQKSDFGSFRWKKSRRRKTENSPRSSLCCLHGWKKLACVEKVWFITKSLGFNNLIKKFV